MNPGNSLTATLIPVLLVVILLLLLGGLAAWWLSSLRRPARKKVPTSQKGDLVELFRLHRARNSKTIYLETGGRVYRSRAELTVNQVDQLSVLLGELLVWLGKPDLAQRAAEALGAGSSMQPLSPAESVMPAPLGEVKRRSRLLNPLDALVSAVAADVSQRPAEQKSIAALIDEILQAKLAGIGMDEPSVRLLELPEGGLAVAVGKEQYGGIDEIPDETVRRLIRESVAEWEKQGPA